MIIICQYSTVAEYDTVYTTFVSICLSYAGVSD